MVVLRRYRLLKRSPLRNEAREERERESDTETERGERERENIIFMALKGEIRCYPTAPEGRNSY